LSLLDPTLMLFLIFVALLVSVPFLIRVSSSRSLSRVRSLIKFLSEGITLTKPLKVEFGVLRARGYYSNRGYHVVTEFLSSSNALVESISYEGLCSSSYLLAVDSKGVGYLVAPAVKVISREGRNVVIACLDPSKTPKISKLVEVSDSRASVKSEVRIINSKYVVKASWPASSAGQWKVLYDEKKGVYTVTTEPSVEGKVRNAVVKLCVKPSTILASEVCRKVLEFKKPGEEALTELEGLQERRIFIEHLNLVNLGRLAKSLGITAYPHISGYAENMVKVKLILNVPFSRDVVKEEAI